MNRHSLLGHRAFAAAIVVVGAAVLGLLQASGAAAAPPKGQADVLAPAHPKASAPVPGAASAVGGIIGPIGGGVIKPLAPPLFPGLYTIQAMPLAVTIGWYDRSTDEQKFVLYRRDGHGAWQEIYEVPTRNVAGGGDYSYVDTNRSLSGQCYMVAAVNQNGSGYTKEECTVRPDPSRFPQSVPQSVQQWFGLNSVNDGTGNLQTTTRSSYTSLTWSGQTFGVDLDWSEYPALWKIEAQGGPHLMRGQAVALRVWGGGWLKYGNQTWGVDLQLSDTPVLRVVRPGRQAGHRDRQRPVGSLEQRRERLPRVRRPDLGREPQLVQEDAPAAPASSSAAASGREDLRRVQLHQRAAAPRDVGRRPKRRDGLRRQGPARLAVDRFRLPLHRTALHVHSHIGSPVHR